MPEEVSFPPKRFTAFLFALAIVIAAAATIHALMLLSGMHPPGSPAPL